MLGEFNAQLVQKLPETHALLKTGNLVIHDAVNRVTLHGSRGLAGNPRIDSDIDLAFITDDSVLTTPTEQPDLLTEVLTTTLNSWLGNAELDLAVVFDRKGCGLKCLKFDNYDFSTCLNMVDCMGIFKLQKGFTGYVDTKTVDCRKMKPSMTIWERPIELSRKGQNGILAL